MWIALAGRGHIQSGMTFRGKVKHCPKTPPLPCSLPSSGTLQAPHMGLEVQEGDLPDTPDHRELLLWASPHIPAPKAPCTARDQRRQRAGKRGSPGLTQGDIGVPRVPREQESPAPHCIPSTWSRFPAAQGTGQPQAHPALYTAANTPGPRRKILFPMLQSSAETGKLS